MSIGRLKEMVIWRAASVVNHNVYGDGGGQ